MDKSDRPFTTAECKQFFDFIDEDGSGSIDLTEIQRLLRILGMDDDVTFARRVMQEANVSRDAEISWNDFYNTVNPKKSSQFSNQEVHRAFQFFSGKESPPNKIHKTQLEKILKECRPEREVKTMMQQLPFDAQGYLNYTDFVNIELLDGISTTPSPAQTCITVVSPAGRCTFPIPESVRMVRDLLAYVNKKQSDGVVALASESGAEVLDVLLQDENSNCDFLRDGDVLVAIPRELVSGEVNLSHFSLLKVIGRGGTSTVYSVRKKDTGRLYALKVLTKRFLIKEDKLAQIFSEREVLIKAASPFVVKLHWLFQSEEHIFLVLDLCAGGDLFWLLKSAGRLTEEQAKFYFAEVMLALEFLHSLDVLYRDLKPENVLLDADGHVKLGDFGSCKLSVSASTRCSSFCGSPEYMSPEMLQGRGYTRSIDFYSLGALLYETITGLPPFYETSRAAMYKKIQTDAVTFPKFVSKEARDLIAGLLAKDPRKRLGHRHCFFDLKTHPWCQSIQWDRVRQHRKAPPFIPSRDVSHFAPEHTSLPLELPECDTPVVSANVSLAEESVLDDSLFEGIEYNGKPGRKLELRMKSADFSYLSTESTKTTMRMSHEELAVSAGLSLADKIRLLQDQGFEPTSAVTDPTSAEVLDGGFPSPRFRLETQHTRGPGFSPIKPASKQRHSQRIGSFGESFGTVSDSEDL